ncbi:MAG: hypothetical protein ACOC7K_00220 [bacterium]
MVFIFGVVNLSLGFGLAMYLSRAAPAWWEDWKTLVFLCRFTGAKQVSAQQRGGNSPQGASSLRTNSNPNRAPQVAEQGDSENHDQPAPERETLKRLKKNAEIAARKLAGYKNRLQDPDSMGFTASPWKFVGELQELCQPYMNQLSEMADKLANGADEYGCGASPSDPLQTMLLDLMAQLETTLSNLEYMDFDSGFSAAIERIRTETNTNLSLTRKLQEAVEAELAKQQ